MAIDTQYMTDKLRDQEAARGEHVRKLLVELIDQICRDFELNVSQDRDQVINIIERYVTKRRTWL